jgi:hypothetical protein
MMGDLVLWRCGSVVLRRVLGRFNFHGSWLVIVLCTIETCSFSGDLVDWLARNGFNFFVCIEAIVT